MTLQGQGHGVKGQGQINSYVKKMNGGSDLDQLICMIDIDKKRKSTHMIEINEKIKLIYVQGHEVKGQGQIYSYAK